MPKVPLLPDGTGIEIQIGFFKMTISRQTIFMLVLLWNLYFRL